jgi:protein O-GlcNAc transferase
MTYVDYLRYSRGNLDKSIYYYQEALKANPQFAQTLNNLGVIYTMLGKLDEAYSYCEKAIQANSLYAEAYNNLGVLYRDEGLITEAIASYNHCLTLDPNSRNAGQNRLLAMNSVSDTSMDVGKLLLVSRSLTCLQMLTHGI